MEWKGGEEGSTRGREEGGRAWGRDKLDGEAREEWEAKGKEREKRLEGGEKETRKNGWKGEGEEGLQSREQVETNNKCN